MSYYRKFILVVLLFINTSYVAHADENKAGLPQLDFNTYPSLVFWSSSLSLPLLAVIGLTGLEFLVAALQAYVFSILTCMYLHDAIHLH